MVMSRGSPQCPSLLGKDLVAHASTSIRRDHVVAALGESSTGVMGDTGPTPLMEHVDHQGCDVLETSPVEILRARRRELVALIYATHFWLRMCDYALMENERKAQNAFVTKRREHLQSLGPIPSRSSGGQTTSNCALAICQVVCAVRDGESTTCTSSPLCPEQTRLRDSQRSLLTSVFFRLRCCKLAANLVAVGTDVWFHPLSIGCCGSSF